LIGWENEEFKAVSSSFIEIDRFSENFCFFLFLFIFLVLGAKVVLDKFIRIELNYCKLLILLNKRLKLKSNPGLLNEFEALK